MDPAGLTSCREIAGKLEFGLGWDTDKAKGIGDLLGKAAPCSMQLTFNGQYKEKICPKCCSESAHCGTKSCTAWGQYGNYSGRGGGGFKISCSPKLALGVWYEGALSFVVSTTIDKDWDTCVPKQNSKICLHTAGEGKISVCGGGKGGLGEGKVCMSISLRCNGSYCTGPDSDGSEGSCEVVVATEGCLKLGPFGGCVTGTKTFPLL